MTRKWQQSMDQEFLSYGARSHGQDVRRIQARHILIGETRYFLAWPALTEYLASKLDAAGNPGADA